MTDIFTSIARKEARRARRQEENRARIVALLEELIRQNERFHGDGDGWRIQLDKVASQLVYEDGLVGPDSAPHHPGN